MSTQSIPLVDNTLEQINSKKKSTISQEIGSNSADMLDTISDPKAINASPTPQPKHMPSLSTGHTDSFGLQGSNVSLPPPPMNENMHPEDLSYTRKKLVFFLLVLLEAIVNFDSGKWLE
ncbi:hypothetical protein SARC_10215 [Sphaeroforma arctica JP610]|uniref:Uncharacterized protein n=1 Tax=Sphaeroforma arctica JP610 TaxID=667725 RepID=A0A0L0FLF4_9EUKA|nr:hypothetical protein SARC_10215 [Sphaeroforma arctica JP610]KNC77321.1 hypothetical protein SARC_10215 [Sphaeroforma arctica JP610]|eukprot:XP_014151223.1 hypothetical protein SARC_10215 [Sphaeroforma arctica JP610]